MRKIWHWLKHVYNILSCWFLHCKYFFQQQFNDFILPILSFKVEHTYNNTNVNLVSKISFEIYKDGA